MFWGLWGPSGTDVPMPPWLFSCVGRQSTPALPVDLGAQDISQAPHDMGQGSSHIPPSPAPQPSLSVVEGFLDTAAQGLPVLPGGSPVQGPTLLVITCPPGAGSSSSSSRWAL